VTDRLTVRVVTQAEGAIVQILLNQPKANILDAEMVRGLRRAIQGEAAGPEVRAVIIEGEGSHFSFGASVEEHLPAGVAEMLRGFHGLFKDLVALRRPLIAAVRGQCLGGGLELAAFCHRLIASPHASLGQPEILLGVFAPLASFVLPRRMGQAAADDVLLSGRALDASEALALGLVDEIAEDPGEAALAYARRHLLKKSAASLGVAVEAARYEFNRAFLSHIDYLETLYLERLMGLHDAQEGIRAFLEKRPPHWTHS